MNAQPNLIGLKIIDRERGCCCSTDVCVIGASKGPHVGELRCVDCGRHRGWLSKEVFCWLASVVEVFGAPSEPIGVTEDRKSEAAAVTADERRRRIYEVQQRIALGNFALEDFFLTKLAKPLRDYRRNEQRFKIARLMVLYKLTVHDLSTNTELPSDLGAVGEGNGSAPESETKMDMSEFAGSRFLRVADLEKSGSFKAKIVAVTKDKKFGKANVSLSEGSTLSLNVTNCQTLIRSFGAESNDWLGKEIDLYLGEVEYEGEMKPTILVRVISAEVEHKAPVKPQRKKGGDGNMDDEIPF
jgi:hypothetical protein